VLHDQDREKRDSGAYVPLQHMWPSQARFDVIDSVLVEEARARLRVRLRHGRARTRW
jgi:2-oxoglutarate dehydrogenase complex dehydrogenase (E1) component-like enzyme